MKRSYSEYSSLDNNVTIRQQEMEMANGKAANKLRKDYPNFFKHFPDYDIYDPDVELVDPSGTTLHGLANYEQIYVILCAIVNFAFNKTLSPPRYGHFIAVLDGTAQNLNNKGQDLSVYIINKIDEIKKK